MKTFNELHHQLIDKESDYFVSEDAARVYKSMNVFPSIFTKEEFP